MTSLPIHKLSKFGVLYKAWQGGKTFDMFEWLKNYTNDNNLHIIFTDNYIIQGSQLVSRIHGNKTIETIPIPLNCKATSPSLKNGGNWSTCGAKNYLDVKNIIEETNRNIVIAPTNMTKTHRLSEHLRKLIRGRSSSDFPDFEGVFIWIDEIDKNVKFFKKEMALLNSMECTKLIYGMTATGMQNLFKEFDEEIINLFEPSELQKQYEGFKNHDIIVCENNDTNDGEIDCQFFRTVLDQDSSIVRPGSKIFAPSLPFIENHNALKELALSVGIDYVVVINGKNKAAFNQDAENWVENLETVIPIQLEETGGILDAAMSKMAKQLDWDNKSVLITGHFCVTRGITIQYKPRVEEFPDLDPFLFTHAIVPLTKKIKNTQSEKSQIAQQKFWDDFSQMAARANGNYGDLRTTPMKFYTNEDGKKILLGLEKINNTLAYERKTICKSEFHEMLEENMSGIVKPNTTRKVENIEVVVLEVSDTKLITNDSCQNYIKSVLNLEPKNGVQVLKKESSEPGKLWCGYNKVYNKDPSPYTYEQLKTLIKPELKKFNAKQIEQMKEFKSNECVFSRYVGYDGDREVFFLRIAKMK